MPVQLHSVDGYKYTHGKILSGWIEFPHPATPGFLVRVQILIDAKGNTVLHDTLNRPVVLADTFLAAAILWWKRDAPKNCKFYYGKLDI